MKPKLYFLLIASFIFTGCATMIGPGIHNAISYNGIVVVSEINDCVLVGKVLTRVRPYRDRTKEAYIGGINSLKLWMNVEKIKGNSLYNIHMTEPEYPLAQADVYQCQESIFNKFKPLQKDKSFIYSQIKFDLIVDEEKINK